MKKSEELFSQAKQEDNDLKYMGLVKKAMREERMEIFRENVLPELRKQYEVEDHLNHFSMYDDKNGRVTIYPKANQVSTHRSGFRQKWHPSVIKFIRNNLSKNVHLNEPK